MKKSKKVLDSSEGFFVWDSEEDKFWRFEMEAGAFCEVPFLDITFEEWSKNQPEETEAPEDV